MNSKYSGQQVEAILDKANAGASTKIVQLPDEVFNLVGTTSEDSAAILQAFGSKEAMIKLVQQISDADIVCIKPSEGASGGASGYLNSLITSVEFTDNDNFQVILLFSLPSACVTFITFAFGFNAGNAAIMSINSSSIPDELAGIILTKDDIVNNLTSTSTRVPLSAAQGKVLNEKIESMSGGGGSGGAYQLPFMVSTLTKNSTHQEIQDAFDNKYDDFIQAVKAGRPIILSGNMMEAFYFNIPISASILNDDNTECAIISYIQAGYNASYHTIGAESLYINKQKTSGTLSVEYATRASISNS